LQVQRLLDGSVGAQELEPAKVKPDPISLRQAFNFAWPILKKRFGLFAAVLLTIFGAWAALEIIVIAGQRFGILLWAAAHLAFLIFAAGVELGLLQVCLALYKGGEPTFAAIFAKLSAGPKFLTGQILYLLMVLVGLALLAVPGVYLGARYALFGFCMAAGETDLIGSFRASAILSTGTKIYMMWILLALLFLNVLGASLLGLGLIITFPLSVLMMTAVYRQLSDANGANPAPDPHRSADA
jgi:uncharacterized membrane protein